MPQSKESRREIYRSRKAAGMCVQCGKWPPVEGKLSCDTCTTSHKVYAKTSGTKLRKARQAAGVCLDCGGSLGESPFVICLSCNEQEKTKSARLREAWRQKRKENNLCRGCGGPLENGPHVQCSLCREEKRIYRDQSDWWAKEQPKQQQRQQILKREVFDAYGGCSCACCGEAHIEFLSIDHVNGGGEQHRAVGSVHRYTGTGLYRWLKRHEYPEGYRVLCMNCNFSLGRFKYCPHQQCEEP